MLLQHTIVGYGSHRLQVACLPTTCCRCRHSLPAHVSADKPQQQTNSSSRHARQTEAKEDVLPPTSQANKLCACSTQPQQPWPQLLPSGRQQLCSGDS